ncbi:MAG: excinuclease ABC subunit C, partial [Gemmatimonadaceae bacterium]|nr:excinuclease ABC subunit C [Gemmatimonadaceae bacterium]
NRKRRTMRTITSALLEVPGVGPTKRRELLRAFGSIDGVRNASEEQIAALKGFSRKSAAALLAALRATAPERAGDGGTPEASAAAEAASGEQAGEGASA